MAFSGSWRLSEKPFRARGFCKMATLHCMCGHDVYFDNHVCGACGRALAYDPRELAMRAETEPGSGLNGHHAFCSNRSTAVQCNWVRHPEHNQCLSCLLSRIIPTLEKPGNEAWWRRLEAAKRVLIRDLLSLGLPVAPGELSFEFMEDRRTNPRVDEDFVLIGHRAGVITINAAEADDLFRESMRIKMGESVRTLLGHMRHESGHYYFDVVLDEDAKSEARMLFGDERSDYEAALANYYQDGPRADWSEHWITPYASSHPSEDWAECWSHYLQVRAVLDVAVAQGWITAKDAARWHPSGATLLRAVNDFCRGLGLPDAYPYVWTQSVSTKIDFIHHAIARYGVDAPTRDRT